MLCIVILTPPIGGCKISGRSFSPVNVVREPSGLGTSGAERITSRKRITIRIPLKGSLRWCFMSTNFRVPDTVVDYQQIEARAEAVIERFEANRDVIWKQDATALAELLQAKILARAVLEKLRTMKPV